MKKQAPHRRLAYLCSTYAVGEAFFDETAKEMFKSFLHHSAEFFGVKIITYSILADHLHILVLIEKDGPSPDAEYLRRLRARYPHPTPFLTAKFAAIEESFKLGLPESDKIREDLQSRVSNLSEFMKSFKQQSAIWFNREHNRLGPLWPVRYDATIYELQNHESLRLAAAYIDLNSVRYGYSEDPKEYRWSGIGEAASGNKSALSGLRFILDNAEKLPAAKVLAAYQKLLTPVPHPKNGKLSIPERLRRRMPWFTHGRVVGSRDFVQSQLDEYRAERKRLRPISPLPFSLDTSTDWPDIYTMRAIH
jgi:hypothetical protein